jgi:hypothetical protein
LAAPCKAAEAQWHKARFWLSESESKYRIGIELVEDSNSYPPITKTIPGYVGCELEFLSNFFRFFCYLYITDDFGWITGISTPVLAEQKSKHVTFKFYYRREEQVTPHHLPNSDLVELNKNQIFQISLETLSTRLLSHLLFLCTNV